MTNPDNAVGTNAAYGGRTSANAFNDDLAAYSRGVMSGWACAPSSGLTVVLGGDGSTRDVAVAEDNAGNKTTINNISGSPVSVTLDAAPASNSRIDAIVAYVDNPPQGSSTIADNYEACGLIAVAGTAASSPVAPTDGAIRSAITADGASGATAYYVVLATITIASGTTDIVAGDITAGLNAMIQARNLDVSSLNLTSIFTQSGSSSWTASKGTPSGALLYKVSADGKFGVIWGNASSDGTNSGQVFTAQTPFRPTTTTSIDRAALMRIGSSGGMTMNGVTINTNGNLSFTFNAGWGAQTSNAFFDFVVIILD